jgi:hypothetical protein
VLVFSVGLLPDGGVLAFGVGLLPDALLPLYLYEYDAVVGPLLLPFLPLPVLVLDPFLLVGMDPVGV